MLLPLLHSKKTKCMESSCPSSCQGPGRLDTDGNHGCSGGEVTAASGSGACLARSRFCFQMVGTGCSSFKSDVSDASLVTNDAKSGAH